MGFLMKRCVPRRGDVFCRRSRAEDQGFAGRFGERSTKKAQPPVDLVRGGPSDAPRGGTHHPGPL